MRLLTALRGADSRHLWFIVVPALLAAFGGAAGLWLYGGGEGPRDKPLLAVGAVAGGLVAQLVGWTLFAE